MTKSMTILKQKEWPYDNLLPSMDVLHTLPYSIFLDSNRPSHPLSRYSFIGWNPIETITWEDDQNPQGFFGLLDSTLKKYGGFNIETPLPFSGGLMGYISYDIGKYVENISDKIIDDQKTPLAQFGVYTNILAFDHHKKKAWIIYQDQKEKEFLLDRIHDRTPSASYSPTEKINWHSDISDDAFKNNVSQCIEKIYQGNIYQINMTRRFAANKPDNFCPWAHYKHLRTINTAPFSAYCHFPDATIASCSPEQFMSVQSDIVETRPIKGTIAADKNPNDLENDPKERAENIMIVDLLRNDISKVCQNNSVHVPSLCQVEQFEGLYHLVSTVTGKLDHHKNAIDVLRHTLPGGSITGAPKISAMKLIEKIEQSRRHIYCGNIGYIGFNNNMDMNIAIRTIIHTNDTIYFNVGSGIVSDSTPEKELQETYNKAQKIFESFQ